MANQEDIFELDYDQGRLKVDTINLPGQVLFRVSFPNSTPPLVLCRANDFNLVKFWTSVPEGRQKLAEEIGPLIESYFKAKQQ